MESLHTGNDSQDDKENSLKGISMAQQNIYDDDKFFESFKGLREGEINFNDLIETPILLAMMPDLKDKRILDVGCGMGQHAMQYIEMGASCVLGTDISEKMLGYARKNNTADNIRYMRLPFEELDKIDESFDVVTSSLAFDYAEDLCDVLKKINNLLIPGGKLVFSISNPISTAYDGVYDRYTRTEDGVRLYANLHNYNIEGLRKFKWVVDGYEVYHRRFSTLVNNIVSAGFIIEECQESQLSEEIIRKYPDRFDGLYHQPDFIFFRCCKMTN